MMLKRKIEKELSRFLLDNGRYALLVTGARQVGKTFSIEQFGKQNYDNFVEINFIREPEAMAIFNNVPNADEVFMRLSAYAKLKTGKKRTLVFLDEIQRCPEAVTYMKFLVQRGDCHYILSGSLLGVELKDIRSVPVGFMSEVQMFPLDFEEFLWANGISEDVLLHAQDAYNEKRPVDAFIHNQLMRYFRLYLVTGGMPDAVNTYLRTNDLAQVAAAQRRICIEYKRDISQYDPKNALRIRDIYDRLPSELNQPNRRFTIGAVLKGSHFDRLEDGFLWLKEAGVAIPAYNLDEPRTPLELARKRNTFKFFANDVGLLASMYMNGIQLRLLNNDVDMNIGAIYENVVAQELKAHGFSPSYFNSKKQGELDFVIENDGHALPIEVKSGKDYKRHSALDNVLKDSNYNIPLAYVLCNDNVAVEGKIIYLPIYMTMFIKPPSLPEKLIYKIE